MHNAPAQHASLPTDHRVDLDALIRSAAFNYSAQALNARYDVVVPVFNAFTELQALVVSLLAHTDATHRLHFCNDASDDARVAPWLDQLAQRHPQVHVHHRPHNLGFVHNVNRALAECDRDVVILNSDTRVTAGWLEAMDRVAGEPAVAAVCPLSDNATLLTLDAPHAAQADALADMHGLWFALPTTVGFCLLVKRQHLPEDGLFDAFFHPGYGEECDASMRLRSAGHHLACAVAAFVHHSGQASFTEQARVLQQTHQDLLDLRWPEYSREVQRFMALSPVRVLEARTRAAQNPERVQVMHLVHSLEAIGGVELFTRQLLQNWPADHEHTVLLRRPSRNPVNRLRLRQLTERVHLLEFRQARDATQTWIDGRPAALHNAPLERVFTQWLLYAEVRAVVVHSLVNYGSLQLPLICHKLGVPYLYMAHDHFALCHRFNLLTGAQDALRACGKSHADWRDAQCIDCLQSGSDLSTEDMRTYLQARDALFRQILQQARRVLTPSDYLQDKLSTHHRLHDALRLLRFTPTLPRMQHAQAVTQAAQHETPLHLAFLGTFTWHKGALLFLQVYKKLRHRNIRWSIIGAIEPTLQTHVKRSEIEAAGPYQREDLPERLRTVDAVLACSICAETFSLTLSEAHENGRPVIAPCSGAYPERIEHERTGLLYAANDATALAQAIERATDNGGVLLKRMQLVLRERPRQCSNESAQKLAQLITACARTQAVAAENGQQINAWPQPADSAFARMSDWLQADHVLECAGDWRDDVRCAVLISGTDRLGLQQTREALRRHAPKHVEFQPAALADCTEPLLAVVHAGVQINDNFGNWQHALQRSACALSLADSTLRDRHGQLYAPLFRPASDPLWLQQQPARHNALLIHPSRLPSALWQRVAALLRNGADAAQCVRELLIQPESPPALHFPHPSHSTPDTLWRRQMHMENTADCALPDINKKRNVHAVLFSGKNEALLDARIESLLAQRGASVCRVQVFSASARQTHPDPRVELHPLEQHTETVNAINRAVHSQPSDAVLLLHDNVTLQHDASLQSLVRWLGHWGIDAISPAQSHPTQPHCLQHPVLQQGRFPGGHGVLRDRRFDRREWPLPCTLLHADCSLILRSAWLRAGGLHAAGGPQHTAWQLSARLGEARRRCAVLETEAIHIHGLPGHWGHEPPVPLHDARQDLLPQARALLRRPGDVPAALLPGQSATLDTHFGAFKAAKNRPRVLGFAHNDWASGFYRVKAPLSALAAQDAISVAFVPHHSGDPLASAADLAKQHPDVLLLHNHIGGNRLQALREYREQLDVRIVLSFDDLLNDLPEYNPFARSNPDDISKQLQEAFSLVHRVLVSTPQLAQQWRDWHGDIRVVENRLSRVHWDQCHGAAKGHKPLRIGWAGAQQHRDDLAWLKPLIEHTRARFQWVFFGDRPHNVPDEWIEFHRHTPLSTYHTALQSLALDVAIAPLVDNPFNRAKSRLKLIECGALGIPVIASAIAPYLDTPAWTLPNRWEEWHTALCALDDDDALRAKHGARMRAWVEAGYFLEDHLPEWLGALLD